MRMCTRCMRRARVLADEQSAYTENARRRVGRACAGIQLQRRSLSDCLPPGLPVCSWNTNGSSLPLSASESEAEQLRQRVKWFHCREIGETGIYDGRLRQVRVPLRVVCMCVCVFFCVHRACVCACLPMRVGVCMRFVGRKSRRHLPTIIFCAFPSLATRFLSTIAWPSLSSPVSSLSLSHHRNLMHSAD